jgi:flagellar motor switch protein FliM
MTDVIRRKIDRARLPLAEGAPGADRGWRLALARAARDLMALDLDFRRLAVTRSSLAEVLELAPDRALVALLHGPKGGLGVLLLAPAVTSTLIEMQTLGRLSASPPPSRKPTRIDAAMVAGFVDRALSGLDEALADEADLTWAGGFRYASCLEEVRPLGLLLEEDAYRVLSAEVLLGPAGRSGEVVLVLPAIGRGERPPSPSVAAEDAAPQFSAGLTAQVMQVESRLDAVIARLTLPIRQIMALQAGDVLHLPLAALDAVTLEAAAGGPIAQARLGQNRGMRAVKLLAMEARGRQVAAAPAPDPSAQPGAASDWRAAG